MGIRIRDRMGVGVSAYSIITPSSASKPPPVFQPYPGDVDPFLHVDLDLRREHQLHVGRPDPRVCHQPLLHRLDPDRHHRSTLDDLVAGQDRIHLRVGRSFHHHAANAHERGGQKPRDPSPRPPAPSARPATAAPAIWPVAQPPAGVAGVSGGRPSWLIPIAPAAGSGAESPCEPNFRFQQDSGLSRTRARTALTRS